MMTTPHDPEDLAALLSLDDRPGPARRISSQRAAAMVQAALLAAAPRVHRPGRGLRVAAAAAVVVAVLGAASAAMWWGRRPARGPVRKETPSVVAAPRVAQVPPPEAVVSPPIAPVPVHRPRPAAQERREAEDLLRLANERRGQKRWQEADQVYGRVRRAHGSPQSSYVATLASASLHLEQLGDARGALQLYKEALRRDPHGSLSEEARYGMAEAYRVLGQRDDEARALSAFVAAHPGSPLRGRAEQRLHQLQTP